MVLVEHEVLRLIMLIVHEIATLSDKTVTLVQIIFREVVSVVGRLLINGKEVYELWQACYRKGVAVVENVYKKFRRG